MSDRIKSIKGLFGQNIHYKDGIKVGESWLGLFEGTQNHYDATGTPPHLRSGLVSSSEQGLLLLPHFVATNTNSAQG